MRNQKPRWAAEKILTSQKPLFLSFLLPSHPQTWGSSQGFNQSEVTSPSASFYPPIKHGTSPGGVLEDGFPLKRDPLDSMLVNQRVEGLDFCQIATRKCREQPGLKDEIQLALGAFFGATARVLSLGTVDCSLQQTIRRHCHSQVSQVANSRWPNMLHTIELQLLYDHVVMASDQVQRSAPDIPEKMNLPA